MVPSDYNKIIYKSESQYLAEVIYDFRKNTEGRIRDIDWCL